MASAGAQAAVVPPCDLCGSQEEVNWFCQDCQENICYRCKIGHQGGRKTKNDEIVPINQARYQTTPITVPILCPEHKTKVCELYCKKCEQLICSQCLNIKHKSHEFDSVEKLVESKTSELGDFEKHLHNKCSSYENVISEESQQLSDFISHVDKMMMEVKDESDEIIQEFTQTRDKHISNLSQMKKRAEQIYEKKINSNQTKISDIRKSEDDAKTAKKSGNAQLMIETVNELRQKIPSIVVPTVLKLPLPNFQHNACQPSSILQLDIPDIEAVATQKPPVMPVSQTAAVATEAAIDMNNVKVSVDIQIQDKKELISFICPTENTQLWIAMKLDQQLTQVDTNGCIVKTTDVGGVLCDAVFYYTDILCTTWWGQCVMKVSKDGDSVTAFSDLSPFYTRGLCVTSDKDILVCVVSTGKYNDKNCKVIRLNGKGEITQEIQHNNQKPMFSAPARVSSSGEGDVVVVDWASDDDQRLICTDRSGNHRYTWTGQVGGKNLKKYSLSRVTHNNNNVYITDVNNHCIYVLDSNGRAKQFQLDKKHGIKNPAAIAIDNKGRLWLGCRGAKLYVLE